MVSSVPTVYLDECVPLKVQRELRRRGLRVKLARDVLPPGTDDATHLKICADKGWILITFNLKDFQRLHWLWTNLHTWSLLNTKHGGILSPAEQPPMPEEWAEVVAEHILQRRHELPGTMWRWRLSSKKWERVPFKLP